MLIFKIALFFFSKPLLVDTSSEITKSINEFSIKMYREISQTETDNIVFSPFSFSNAFAMLRIGSKHNTKNELDKVFSWKNFEKILEESDKLYAEITERYINQSFLAIGNRIWVDDEITLLNTYVEDIYKLFKVKPERVSFKTSPESARLKINKWIEQQTNNAIKKVLPPGSIPRSTKILLSNAIYFNATWKNPFDTTGTATGNFFMSKGGAIKAHYMFAKSHYAMYIDGANGVTLLEIPYSGDRFSMIFVRPNEPSKLYKLERKLNYKMLMIWISALKIKKEKTEIRIPKFEIEQTLFAVKKMLENMGLNDIFSKETADLSGINGKKDLYCSKVFHKAYMKVDEKGTSAASIVFLKQQRSYEETRNFTLDRSFLFYIIDKRNDIVIFAGRVVNPSVNQSDILSRHVRVIQEAVGNSNAVRCFSSYITFVLPVVVSSSLTWT